MKKRGNRRTRRKGSKYECFVRGPGGKKCMEKFSDMNKLGRHIQDEHKFINRRKSK